MEQMQAVGRKGILLTNHEALSRVSVPSLGHSRGFYRVKIKPQRKDTSNKKGLPLPSNKNKCYALRAFSA